jgi:hypothetical protein
MFSTSSKSQNQVKISYFLTILIITRKVITIEEWTKNLKNWVLSEEYAKKRITKIRKKTSALRSAEVRALARSWLGKGGGVAQQWLYLPRSHFGKFMYFSKNVSWVYLVKYFWVKNGVFGDLKAKMCAKLPVFPPFSYILGGLEGLFDFYDPLHHHPWTGRYPCQ